MAANGQILWHDLTVPHAEEVRDFYSAVLGWNSSMHDMGTYNDFNMIRQGSEDIVAGVCHARGSNAAIPPQWLMYVKVENVETACKNAVRLGGTIVDGPRVMGGSNVAIVKDPAGAVMAIIE